MLNNQRKKDWMLNNQRRKGWMLNNETTWQRTDTTRELLKGKAEKGKVANKKKKQTNMSV